nr:cytotoxic translational repressor of toxin-antitoxin stability system [Kineosphaera limosa]
MRFCENEGWQEVGRATGGRVNHYLTFQLPLPDGRVLRTRISDPPNKDTYGAGLWKRILRDQLDVDEAAFWACVRDNVPPPRGMPTPERESIPVDLYRLLIGKAGLSEREVSAMTRDEAITAVATYWSRGE